MMKIFLAVVVALFTLQSSDAFAAKRKHITIIKPAPMPARTVAHPAAAVLVVAVPIGALYDLQRRVQCLDPPDPAGLGGVGFDRPVTPKDGNVMIPCWQRQAMKAGYRYWPAE